MSTVEHKILGVLEEHVSHLTARSLLRRALDACSLTEPAEWDVPQLVHALEGGVRLFVPEGHQPAVLERLEKIGGTGSPAAAEEVLIEREEDVTKARSLGRSVATSLEADAFTIQKVVTTVSELARNIVLYAGRGTVEIGSRRSPPAMHVVARDQGPGIDDLERILSGRYQSRTGLGRGLLGVRRLADRFDVDTGAAGTVVRTEFIL
ncbi:MAG: ATP-binding protein [Myxococcota bacterium]